MTIEMIASAIMNHVYNGTAGLNSNMKISHEQLLDEVVAERNIVLKEYILKGIVNLQDLYLSINCVPVSCDYMSKCCDIQFGEKALHFEIPQLMNVIGSNSIKFIGSVDRSISYKVYTDDSYRFHKYKIRGGDKPYVYIDQTVNANGNLDGYIFNMPFTKMISVVALFSDPRDVLEFDCCSGDADKYLECGVLSDEIIKRLTEKYIR